VICFPNAKLNFGLHVVEKRPDGFHNIETIFYPVALYDVFEIIPTGREGIEFTVSGLPIPGAAGSNLIQKAIKLMSDTGNYHSPVSYLFASHSLAREGSKPPCEQSEVNGGLGVQPGIRIHLHKIIPMGAGLGGGSSDAASALKLLNDLWQLELSVSQLQELARQLGSDCAFFIENRPVFAVGKGDQFEPVELNLSQYQIVIVVPPVHISTPEAYAMINPGKSKRSLKEIIRLPVEEWKEMLINDFEEPVMNKYPVIREIKEELYSRGAIYTAMSGSGAAVYGIFSSQLAVGSWQFDPTFVSFII